jgi:hypothetical protein
MDATERTIFFKTWARQFGGWFLVYTGAYAAALWAVATRPESAVRSALILLPVAPGCMLIWATVRNYRACDEFVQRQILEAVAITATVTAFWTLAYAYLELLGLPHLSVGFVHTVGWPIFIFFMIRLMRFGS